MDLILINDGPATLERYGTAALPYKWRIDREAARGGIRNHFGRFVGTLAG
jgi:hypothetical protein